MSKDPGEPVVDTSSGSVAVSAPALFGVQWGAMTAMGLVIGHVVYGLIAALIYGALV